MAEIIATISLFAEQWLGTVLSKLFLLFLGILLCLLVVAAIWDRRIRALNASIVIGLGVLLVAVALWENFALALGGMDTLVRIRLVAVLLSVFILVLTFFAFVRTGLHPRYGLLWTVVSCLVLLTALFPKPLQTFPSLLGVHFAPAIAALVLLFALLLIFHFCIVISELQDQQKTLMHRIQDLERQMYGRTEPATDAPFPDRKGLLAEFVEKLPSREMLRSLTWKTQHGTSLTVPVVIFLAASGVMVTGMAAPQVMIGDEVTHYYMMRTQTENYPEPNFFAEIPTGWGDVETRRYPHSFFWHYIGGLVYLATNGSFFFTQLYQALFLCQLLVAASLLAGLRRGVETRSALVYVLLIVSLPMTLIFSVAFYQDVPMAAQALTAFYFLRKNRWFLATVFLCLALGFKVTALLFFPAFYVCLAVWTYRNVSLRKTLAVIACSLLLTGGFTLGFGKVIERYAHVPFYPVKKAEEVVDKITHKLDFFGEELPQSKGAGSVTVKEKSGKGITSEKFAEIIANHPGDLRVKANFFIYGGILLYLSIFGALAAEMYRRASAKGRSLLPAESSIWLWATGGTYILSVIWFLKEAPDARFFLPGLLFCLLPLAERVVCLPRSRLIVMLITALALMQSGYALAKTYRLRLLTPETREAIHYLGQHPPEPRKVFMYPEGNYRSFPVPHEWYLNYYLRDFWRADNDGRIDILNRFNVGAVVIKKHLIAQVDEDFTNLGVYPDFFVQDIKHDQRFSRVFENSDIIIFTVPSPASDDSDRTSLPARH
ncbi:MAG: DUF2304 family protein [Desulfobulbaceae bacterium]|nr:MAG: DUF2304 family protein [Desulfobulbaceae bacterium]